MNRFIIFLLIVVTLTGCARRPVKKAVKVGTAVPRAIIF